MIVEQEVAGALGSHKTGGWRNDLDNQGAFIPAIAPTLPAHGNDTGGDRPPDTTADTADSLIAGTVSSKWAKGTGGPSGDECQNIIVNASTDLVTHPLTVNAEEGVMSAMAVRRLTPRECERLMGFPDDHTLIPWRGKPAELCPDGPRYRALGNSMAVPVMRWIGERIQMVEELLS